MNISDVAKKAGVSVATVSRVLNNSPSVTESTIKKVQEAIDLLNYMPNIAGRNLRINKTNNILVIINSLVNTFFSKLIKGIEDKAFESGYNVLICTTDNSPEKMMHYIDLLSKKIADGAILLGIEADGANKTRIKKISETIPLVQCSEKVIDNIPYIAIDSFKAMYDVTSSLIKSGKKRILYISVDNALFSTEQRFDGYKTALTDNGIKFDSDLVIYGNYGYRNAIEITEKFLQKKIKFDAVAAIGDRMASGALYALKNNNYKIPDDIFVFGFDNVDLCYMSAPTLSSVNQHQYDIGAKAVETVVAMLNNQPYNMETITDYELIFRESATNKGGI